MALPPQAGRDPAELLGRLDSLRQAERRTASARMVTVIGHLIGTPLNVIAGRASLLTPEASPEVLLENARRIEGQVERLSQRIRRLVDYFGAPEPPPELSPLSQIVEESLELYRPIAELRGVAIELEPHNLGSARINCSLGLLSLTALLSLAIRTTPEGQRITLAVRDAGPRRLALELGMLGVATPPERFERLELPDRGYDADTLEVLSLGVGLARRNGGSLQVTKALSGQGSIARFVCDYA
jgi:signal transduction histidine kinase